MILNDCIIESLQYTLNADDLEALEKLSTKKFVNDINGAAVDGMLLKKLTQIKHCVEYGAGFFLLRGFDPSLFSNIEDLFLALSSTFGYVVNQNNNGDLFTRVEDQGISLEQVREQGVKKGDQGKQTKNRPYMTKEYLDFHTDLADMAVLYCVRNAKSGGQNIMVSSVMASQYIYQNYRACFEELKKPYMYFHQDWKQKDYKPHPVMMPPFSYQDHFFSSYFIREFILASHEVAGVELEAPRLDAINCLKDVCQKEELQLRLTLKPGDVLLMNSHTTYHAREAFSDFVDPSQKRLLLRSWIATNSSRPLSPYFDSFYGSCEAEGIRGGFYR